MILVTGGAGYIGSHTCIALHEAGFDFVIFDNLSNSSKEALKRVKKFIGRFGARSCKSPSKNHNT